MGRVTDHPELDGVHHVTLSVGDLDTSIEWYTRVLGYRESLRVERDGVGKAMLIRDDCVTISFVAHGDSAVEGLFDEHRAGLDHLGFAVRDRAELDRWIDVLDAHGIGHNEPVRGLWGWVVSFRDPDNIALEFYTRE